jgi:hypothetical protein
MIQFITLAGSPFDGLNQLLDLNNPFDDLKLAILTNILLFRRDNVVGKLTFIIDSLPFMTLYDTIMHAKQLETELVSITVVFTQKPVPPSSPSIRLYGIDTNDLCDLPVSFLEWYEYEDAVKNCLDTEYVDFANASDKYRFQYNCFAFDNLHTAITVAIMYSLNNQDYDIPMNLDVSISPGSQKTLYSKEEDDVLS